MSERELTMQQGMTSPVDYCREGPIVTIRLNDPANRNGLSPAMVEALCAALARLNQESDVRCAILTAEGSVFSAGGDPRRMLAPGLYPDMSAEQIRQFYRAGIQRLPIALSKLDVPLIGAINGPAVGAGCDLACWCDLRIASDKATFAFSFVKLGLVPGDGGAWLIPRLIGLSNAAELLLTGDTLNADEARKMGLISDVVSAEDLLPRARALAGRIAANAPHAVRMTKRLMSESSTMNLSSALELSASLQAACHKMADHREAVEARIEKRPPQFTGK